MKTLIVPLPKSPWSTGRIGPREWQDWSRECRLAANLIATIPNAEILIVSGMAAERHPRDADLYQQELLAQQVPEARLRIIREGVETIEQLEHVERLAREEGARVILISTFLHFPRVRWLCRGMEYAHRIAWGLPRPREALTDMILAVAFPLLDLLGLRTWFQRKTKDHRKAGKL